LEYTEYELRDAAAKIFVQEVDNDELMDQFSRDLISPNDLVDRLVYLRKWAESIAPSYLDREIEEGRAEAKGEMQKENSA
jgi:hypothetical protein